MRAESRSSPGLAHDGQAGSHRWRASAGEVRIRGREDLHRMYTLCNGGKKHFFYRPSIWQGKGFPAGVPPGSSAEHQCTGSIIHVDCSGCSQRLCNVGIAVCFLNPRLRNVPKDVDSESKIAEAISTCPVDCIYWVDYEDLTTLEKERSGLDNGIMVAIAPTPNPNPR